MGGNPIPRLTLQHKGGGAPLRHNGEEQPMADMKAQTITLHEGDKLALEYIGAAVVLQWSNLPEDVRKAILQQADSVGGLPVVADLHEQIQALIRRLRG
jgi:hypothetical protein